MDRLITLGLSDLHIGRAPCPISDNFFALLKAHQNQVDTLIIAGDLFDYWIGNDLVTEFQWSVADEINALGASQAWFLPGNRDFLLSKKFARRAGLQIAEFLTHHGRLWTHGDEYCLDDADYQAWRTQCRTEAFKTQFLSQPASLRQSMVEKARENSHAKGGQTASAIADVAVRALPTTDIVHGHTHRPAVHWTENARVVMGDWRPDAWVFIEDHQGAALCHWAQGWGQRIVI